MKPLEYWETQDRYIEEASRCEKERGRKKARNIHYTIHDSRLNVAYRTCRKKVTVQYTKSAGRKGSRNKDKAIRSGREGGISLKKKPVTNNRKPKKKNLEKPKSHKTKKLNLKMSKVKN